MSLLPQGEVFLPHQNRQIQVFYQRPPSAKFLAIVSTGLVRTNDVARLEKWIEYLSESERREYAILLYNYPGLGGTSVRSPGVKQSEEMVRDLGFVVGVARDEGWLDGEIFLVGISVGTGPTLQLLRNSSHSYRGVILFSPYLSPTNMTGIDRELQQFFGCPKDEIRGLESFDALKEVAQHKTSQDITIVVGMSDININPSYGADLYNLIENTAHTARLIRINSASHAAVRTVAQEFVRPIFKDPHTVIAGETESDFKQTPYGLLREGISWIHYHLRNLTASL